jgi:hypothetical protein
MLRSDVDEVTGPDPTYPLTVILAGDFDEDLEAWGAAAASFGTPIIVEWGTEMNGRWFAWNGVYYGGRDGGTETFRRTYRHIVERVEAGGARNLVWVFHVSWADWPEVRWNEFENYYPDDPADADYPGTEVVDWVGVSVYGAQAPLDTECPAFAEGMGVAIPRLAAMAPAKPVFVFEFGVSEGCPLCEPAGWADAALSALLRGDWPEVRGFSWWNETWQNDDDPAHDSDMRVQAVPGLADVFRSRLVGAANVVDHPLLSGD